MENVWRAGALIIAAAATLGLGQTGGLALAGGASAFAGPLPAPARGTAIPTAPGDVLLGVGCTSASNCWG